MTSIHPYLRFAPDAKTELWTIVGMGRGEIENARKGASAPEKSDITMWMGAGGARRNLESASIMDWALFGDVGVARVLTEDDVQAIAIKDLTVDSSRLRSGVEGSYTAWLDSGNALTAFAEVAVRFDGGDGGDGVGIEVSPGLSFAVPGSGFGLEARGRALVLHSKESYEEYGASVTASLSPRSGGLGLAMSVSPRWGTDVGAGADALWRETGSMRSGTATAGRERLSLNTRVSYGIAAWRGVVAPFGELDVHEQGSQRMRMGARFDQRLRTDPGALSVGLSGERYEDSRGESDHRIGLTGRLRF